jgi:hypothetical protein
MVRFCLIIVNCAIFHLIPTYALGFFCISPMGSRCNSLHDPRVTGSSPAWLELYTKPKKGSVIPDGLYYDRDSSSFQVNPIIGYHQCKLIGNSNTFEAAYNLVCNLGVPVFDTCFVLPKQSSKLDKVQELCIVRVMHKKQDPSDYNFLYSNKFWLNGQPCMVLQTRYFRLFPLNPNGAAIKLEDIIMEISVAEYDSTRHDMIRADEVVFESKGRFNCNHSIWFDAIIQREHPGSRGNTKSQNYNELWNIDDKALFCMPKNSKFLSSLPTITPYVLMQPKDDCKEGHDLIDAIIEHRIGSLLTSQGYQYYWINNIEALQADFSRLLKITEKWVWPKLSRERMDAIFQKTREEHNKSKYAPLATCNKDATLPAIWNSFVSSLDTNGPHQKKRLDVFVAVTSKDVKLKDELPHITNSRTKFISHESEATWKELLLGEKGAWKKAKLDADERRAF